MEGGLGLRIQMLEGFRYRVLVMLHAASLRSATRDASPAELDRAFDQIRVPRRRNTSQYLAQLAKSDLVVHTSKSRWAVTPLGEKRIREVMNGVSDAQLVRLGSSEPWAPLLSETPHYLIPWEWAPAQFEEPIGNFLEGYDFSTNCFGISRFERPSFFPRAGYDLDPIPPVLEVCRATCEELGLTLHLASDRSVSDLLFSNVAAAMWASRYGIAIVEDTAGEGVNYNVALEIGSMLVTGRPCLLLKDRTVKKLPTDLVGHIYESVDITEADTVTAAIRNWATDRLHLTST